MAARELFAVCNACLRLRADLDEPWIRAASAGKARTTHYCSDDFAFAAPEGALAPTACPHCRNSSVVIAVDTRLARTIAAYVADRRRES